MPAHVHVEVVFRDLLHLGFFPETLTKLWSHQGLAFRSEDYTKTDLSSHINMILPQSLGAFAVVLDHSVFLYRKANIAD